MAIEGVHYQYVRGWATDTNADWSLDYEIPPSSIYCTSQLAGFSGNFASADTGFLQYRVRDPRTGVDTIVTPSHVEAGLMGLAPAFATDNCDFITFWFHLECADGDGVIAMALFNVFFWE